PTGELGIAFAPRNRCQVALIQWSGFSALNLLEAVRLARINHNPAEITPICCMWGSQFTLLNMALAAFPSLRNFGPTFGNSAAKIVVEFFHDCSCPYSSKLMATVIKEVIPKTDKLLF